MEGESTVCCFEVRRSKLWRILRYLTVRRLSRSTSFSLSRRPLQEHLTSSTKLS